MLARGQQTPTKTTTGTVPMPKAKPKPKQPAKPNPQIAATQKALKADEALVKADKADKEPKEAAAAEQFVKQDEAQLAQLDHSHPDVQSLAKAGLHPTRTAQLANTHGVSHPAVPSSFTKIYNPDGTVKGITPPASMTNPGTGASLAPSTPAQYAADVLLQAGLPDTASNEKLLETQMTEEGMHGKGNNPLATTVGKAYPTLNSAGVRSFPNLATGATEEAQTLQQSNMASIFDALKSGTATPQDYAKALAASSYEGLNPGAQAANNAYAAAFLSDAGLPTSDFSAGGSTGTTASSGGVPAGTATYGSSGVPAGTAAIQAAAQSNPFSALGSLIPGLGTQSSDQSLQGALASLGSGAAQNTLTANTSQAPGNPDQSPSSAQQTAVNPASLYQAQLAALLPGIKPQNVGSANG